MSPRFGISTFLALALLPAAAAQASTVSVEGDRIVYSGGDAANQVHFMFETQPRTVVAGTEVTPASQYMRVFERDENITPGAGCTAETPRSVRCFKFRTIVVDAGAGDDNVNLSRAGKYNGSTEPGPGLITTATNYTQAADSGFAAVLSGGDGNDTLVGTSASDIFDGGAGADKITGGAGAADTIDYRSRTAPITVTLGTGADGEAGEGDAVGTDVEFAAGGAGDDTIIGSNSIVNHLYGFGGNDTVNGLSGSDVLYGGDGDDAIDGSANNDAIHGEAGNDSLIGNAGLDDLRGAEGDDTLLGGDDADHLDGGDGNDVHDGGDKADTFNTAQTGADTFDGGLNGTGVNNDLIEWADLTAGISVSQDGVADDGPQGDDNVVNFEVVKGTEFDDVLTGSDGVNNLYGRGGNDVLRGLGGADYLVGGDGDDQLFAGDDTARDQLDCGAGAFDEATFQDLVDNVTNCEVLFASPAPEDPDPEDPFAN